MSVMWYLENLAGKRFCGDCGSLLQDISITAVVEREAGRIVDARLKDQKLVEVEVTQAIVSRLSEWAKLFGFFVGIPVAILLIVLGFLGVRTYADFLSQVKTAREEALKPLQDTKKEADRIATAYRELSAQLDATKALVPKLDELTQKVSRLEQAVNFKPSALLTPTVRKGLEQTFGEYYGYLKSLGFTLSGSPPTISIAPEAELNSYYEPPPANQIVMTASMARVPFPGLRAYTHYVLTSLKGTDAVSDPTGLESGLADYFPSSFSGESDYGKEVWKLFEKRYPGTKIDSRDLDNRRSFSEFKSGNLESHSAGSVWGGAFWQVRQAIGKPAADLLLLQAWKNLDLKKSRSELATFPLELLKQDQRLNAGKYSQKMTDIFRARGLTL